MPPSTIALLVHLTVISLLAVFLTAADKRRAQAHRWRVPEATLWGIAALGGAAAMFLTMRLIRHKTRHLSFMLGLPLLILLQSGLLYGAYTLLMRAT